MSDKTELGDRMKIFEGMEAKRMLMPKLPVMVRIDGKKFSNFTKGLKRPYDEGLTNLMVEVSKLLLREYNALISYTQSDEISLILYSDSLESQLPFNGRVQKLVGDIAAFTTLHFNRLLQLYLPKKYSTRCPRFDCRVWNVPSIMEAANCLLWRELDCSKNSVSMAAHHYFSHKILQNKNGKEMQDMLMLEKDINWNDYPAFFKRGTFVQKIKTERKYSCEEIDKLPLKHQARLNPNLMITRQDVKVIDMPPFRKVVNRVGVIFRQEDPMIDDDSDYGLPCKEWCDTVKTILGD